MSNSHYWLPSAEQAVMDAAIGSASDYGYIAVTDASLDSIVERSPFAISVRDYVAIADLTDVGQQYGAVHRFNLLRLNEFQKGALESDGFAFVACHPDPTGEYWGNIMLDLAKMNAGAPDHLCNPHSNAKQAVLFVQHGSWGSTLAEIQAFAAHQSETRAANSAAVEPIGGDDEAIDGDGYALSDFPAGYVAWVREEQVDRDATDDEVLEWLLDMGDEPETCTRDVINLNVMGGVHFVPGDAPVDRNRDTYGMKHVGFMARDAIFIEADGRCQWDVTDDKHPSTANGYARVRWCLENAVGPWLLIQGDWNSRSEEAPLYLFLLNSGDQARYDAEFPWDVRGHDPRPAMALQAKRDASTGGAA